MAYLLFRLPSDRSQFLSSSTCAVPLRLVVAVVVIVMAVAAVLLRALFHHVGIISISGVASRVK